MADKGGVHVSLCPERVKKSTAIVKGVDAILSHAKTRRLGQRKEASCIRSSKSVCILFKTFAGVSRAYLTRGQVSARMKVR